MNLGEWQFAKTGSQSATIIFEPISLDPEGYVITFTRETWAQLPEGGLGSLKKLLNQQYDADGVDAIREKFFRAQAEAGFTAFGLPKLGGGAAYEISCNVDTDVNSPNWLYPVISLYRLEGGPGYVKFAVNYSASA